ncbi:MAG: 8-oxo-dGTP diphosphatase [Gammaproteobacteria bacterium]|nr:8-oxo-dGTP diphosphatase [Gammaproteobacteria bacterium]
MNALISQGWIPRDRATLVYVLSNQSVLLIRKLRGHGRGKVNAPGGKLESGESAEECAVRELHEEVGIRAKKLHRCATLKFLDLETCFSLEGYVFLVDKFEGTPRGTKEADPFWCPRELVPYESMWEDDRYWLPYVLCGDWVSGEFVFANDKLKEWFVERSLTASLEALLETQD